jgi:hypothetical protein
MKAVSAVKYTGICTLYVSSKMKSMMIKVSLTPVLLYASETIWWATQEENKLENFFSKIYRLALTLQLNQLKSFLRLLRYGLKRNLCIHRLEHINYNNYGSRNDVIKENLPYEACEKDFIKAVKNKIKEIKENFNDIIKFNNDVNELKRIL